MGVRVHTDVCICTSTVCLRVCEPLGKRPLLLLVVASRTKSLLVDLAPRLTISDFVFEVMLSNRLCPDIAPRGQDIAIAVSTCCRTRWRVMTERFPDQPPIGVGLGAMSGPGLTRHEVRTMSRP